MATALVAGAALTGSAIAQDHSRGADASTNQISDQVDARIARIRADLRLTPEQEKNWTGFESAMRDIGKKTGGPRDEAASRSRTTAGLRRHHRTNAQGRQFYERALRRSENARRCRPAPLCKPQ